MSEMDVGRALQAGSRNDKELERWASKAGHVHTATTKQHFMPSGDRTNRNTPTLEASARFIVDASVV